MAGVTNAVIVERKDATSSLLQRRRLLIWCVPHFTNRRLRRVLEFSYAGF